MRTLLLAGAVCSIAGSTTAQAPSSQTKQGVQFHSGKAALVYYPIGRTTGTPLILVSGGPGFESKYLKIGPAFPRLAATRRVIYYDQRGTGKSSAVGPNDNFTIAESVQDLDALRQALGVERIDLLGHSFGGYLAMAYAVEHPDRVAHLILAASAAPKFSDTQFLFAQAFPDLAGGMSGLDSGLATNDKAKVDRALAVYLQLIWWSPANRDAYLKALGKTDFNMYQYAQLSKDMNAKDLSPFLKSFTFPTLVLSGRYDMNVAPATGAKIHQLIPNSKFVILERTSHMLFYEAPDEFVATVRDFLSK